MTNKIATIEFNFEESVGTIDGQKLEIQELRDKVIKLEAENSNLRANNDEHGDNSSNNSNSESNENRELLDENNQLKNQLGVSEENGVKLARE